VTRYIVTYSPESVVNHTLVRRKSLCARENGLTAFNFCNHALRFRAVARGVPEHPHGAVLKNLAVGQSVIKLSKAGCPPT
jgi:hypothetical protein